MKKTDIGIAMGGVGMVVIIVKLVLDIMNGESHLFPNKTTTIACRKRGLLCLYAPKMKQHILILWRKHAILEAI